VQDSLLQGFFLGAARIEPLTGQVVVHGESAHLPPKAIAVLLCLARRPGQLVTRDEILEDVWGKGGGSQEALSRAVSDIRHAFADHHDRPGYLQTVPRQGYRLLLEPSVAADAAAPGSDAGSPPFWRKLLQRGVIQAGAAFLVCGWLLIQVADAVVPIIGLPEWTKQLVTYAVIGGFPLVLVLAWFFEFAGGRFYLDRGKDPATFLGGLEQNYLVVVAAYVLAFLGAAAYQASVGFEVPEAVAPVAQVAAVSPLEVEPNSIAVLQLINIDGSETSRIFGNGLAEDVLDRLARVPGLLVSARGDSWSMPPNSASEQVRERLRVAYFVEGSIRTQGDNLRVVVQLIDSATGFHRLSRSFDRKLQDFAELQREITKLIVADLRVSLPPESESLLLADTDNADVDAYVLYRRGREILQQPTTMDSLADARHFFDQALSVDKDYAAAHAGLCESHQQSFAISRDKSWIDAAERACGRALALNPNLNLVYAALGDLYAMTGQNRDAEQAFRAALEVNGQYVPAILGLSFVQENNGHIDDAEELLLDAMRLQPGNWETIDTYGGFLFANGRYSEAVNAYRNVIELDPNNWQSLGNMGSALMMDGRFAEAADALERSIAIEPDRIYYSNLAIIYYYLGNFDEAVGIHRSAVEESPGSSILWLNLADALSFSSQAEKAPSAYRKAAEFAQNDLEVNPAETMALCRLAWARARLGDHDAALELIAQAEKDAAGNPYVHYFNALLQLTANNKNAAIKELKEAVELGFPVSFLVAEPFLQVLEGDDEFLTLTGQRG